MLVRKKTQAMNRKKYLLGLLVIVVLMSACSSAKIYVVRHSEKSSYPKNDPYLTAEGKARAEELASKLAKAGIRGIYATNTNRTRETATPLSLKLSMGIQIYASDTANALIKNLLKHKKSALVVGHSNTLIPILTAAGLRPSMQEIRDEQYDLLFVVSVKKGKLVLEEQRYGKPSRINE